MEKIEMEYEAAREAQILPGYALLAGTGDKILYSTANGVQSLRSDHAQPFQLDTICACASMTKLVTAVAVLQCFDAGLLDLDVSVSEQLPGIGKYGVMTGWDDELDQAIMTPYTTQITARSLLTHTSGHEYDWFNPLLGKWRQGRGELPWQGATVEEKSQLPLVFEPGTRFAYGSGTDWAGRLIEKITGKSLDVLVAEKICAPLGIVDATFYPKEKLHMEGRIADMSTISEEGPAQHLEFDILGGCTECLGGGGLFASAEAYFAILQAILRREPSLLSESSWTELFRPQLDSQCKRALNEYINCTPQHTQFLGMSMPASVERNWALAGMVCEQDLEGQMREGTIFWGGVPSMAWFIDTKAGICGVAACQVLPPMEPRIMALHAEFQSGVFRKFGDPK
ncbi:beta-lactamase/transpeptidase-like protein [Lophiotrema nucula]|uniref:Beta-lactamase/transpeptidase-like protein n=1 Tax=Lophiotrema nucula TaxID=690887 RepID=A0A6A5YTA8_9PLEO|nr:beta-lactamase/transpeptidase-like protein [Lophiotrema nucula]